MLQAMYALLFILLSVICCLACLIIPKARRYALQALVAPVAFGFCSIVAGVAIGLASDYFHVAIPGEVVVIYFIPGVLGACLALSLVGRTKLRVSKQPPTKSSYSTDVPR
jgi:hypothetical protein